MKKHILIFAVLVSAFPTAAAASPWTLPGGDLSLSVDFDFQDAGSEFLDDRARQAFPLDARFNATSLRLGARYGFTSRLEGGFSATFKSVTYIADPVIIELPEDQVDLEGARASVVDFTRQTIGASDAFFDLRYNLIRGTIALTNQSRVKLPTGYAAPQSTFDEDGFVADDVTLGDGQADLENAFLLGLYIAPTRSFVRFDLGFRFRFSNPGHQVFGSAKVGQFIGRKFVLFVGSAADFTVIDGTPIGQTVVASDGNLTAQNVTPDRFERRDLRLDKDYIDVSGGVLFIVQKGIEVQASYSQIVAGRNIPTVQTVSVGTSFRIPKIGASRD